MANSIAVRYRAFHPEAAGGAAALTAFTGDARSIARYGEKQRVYALGQAAEEEALACARGLLARIGSPRPLPVLQTEASGLGAVIEARGWWETLDWKIAAEPRGRIASPAGGLSLAFGVPGQPKLAQPFQMGADPWPVAEAWLRLRREGAPPSMPEEARLELCADAGSLPGAVLGAASAGQMGDDWGWARFAFSTPLRLAQGRYWLVLSRGGALSNEPAFLASASQSGSLGQPLLAHNGAGWVPCAPPAELSLYINGVEETTEQARRLLLPERCGQFLRGARIEAGSGVMARLYRAAAETLRGRAVIEGLLERGTAGGQRLLACIEPDRTARIYPQPAPERTRLTLAADGTLRRDQRPLALSEQAAGQWARLDDLTPAGVPLRGREKAVFVEACVWDGASLRADNGFGNGFHG